MNSSRFAHIRAQFSQPSYSTAVVGSISRRSGRKPKSPKTPEPPSSNVENEPWTDRPEIAKEDEPHSEGEKETEVFGRIEKEPERFPDPIAELLLPLPLPEELAPTTEALTNQPNQETLGTRYTQLSQSKRFLNYLSKNFLSTDTCT